MWATRRSLKKAGKLIYNLKKNGFIGLISSDIEAIQTQMLQRRIDLAILYSGDALVLAEKSDHSIAYAIPKEGSEFYVDDFVILKQAPNPRLAHQFIDHMLSPQNHAATAMYLQYCCPNQKAREIIQKKAPEQLLNPAIYPPRKVISKLTYFLNTDPEIPRLWDKIFKTR